MGIEGRGTHERNEPEKTKRGGGGQACSLLMTVARPARPVAGRKMFSWLRDTIPGPFTRRDFIRMTFNLKKVLKALLLSSNQPLAIKDVQGAFTRFHEQSSLLSDDIESEDEPSIAGEPGAGAPASEGEPVNGELPMVESTEAPVEANLDAELYGDVPSLITATQIREAMDQIATDLRAADEGLLLIEGVNGYRLVTHPRFARWVRILRAEPPPVKLNQSSIETLAVVAYRQPATRGEIATIRGVSAEAGINKLLERELIYIVGRADTPGRPIQYGTTDQFLEFVGIKALDEMPASDVLSTRQIDEWLKNSSNAHAPSDTDMGLADEQLPLEASPLATHEPASRAPAVSENPTSV